MSGRLAGKVALVAGAGCVGPGWGNGRATTFRFMEEGAHVFAVDLSDAALRETVEICSGFSTELATHLCDVTSGDAVADMVSRCVDRFGRLDVLMNNVGGSAAGGVAELEEDVWDAQVDRNLKSVFLACKHAVPHMQRRGGGAIVNMASTSGLRWTGSAQVAYAATKAGVIQLSRVTAAQYARWNIRVNTIVPGQLHTPLVEARLAEQRAGGDVEALLAQRQARIPIGFMGDGRDTANAAVYLASDEARFVTGTELVVDGGMSIRCD